MMMIARRFRNCHAQGMDTKNVSILIIWELPRNPHIWEQTVGPLFG